MIDVAAGLYLIGVTALKILFGGIGIWLLISFAVHFLDQHFWKSGSGH